MKPKNGSIPIDLIGTKTQLAFLSRVRLIYIGWIWDKSTNTTEIRTWLINLSGVGLAVARESRAGFGLQDSSGSQPEPTQLQKVRMLFSCGPDKGYAEAVKRVVVFSSRSQSRFLYLHI